VGTIDDPDAILARTNAGVVRAALQQIEQGKRVAVPKTTKDELQSLVRTVRWFLEGGDKPRVLNPDLAQFKTWAEVQAAANSGDNPKVTMLFNLVEQTFQEDIREMDDFVESLRIESQVSKEGADSAITSALDGESGNIGEDIQWKVEGKRLSFFGNTFPAKETIKSVKYNNWGPRFDGDEKEWFFSIADDDERLDVVNRMRTALVGGTEDVPEVVITTAHKSKGMEWPKVALFDDFFKPRVDPNTGDTIMPSPEEMRLNYVAATRGREEIDPGGLDWIFAYTSDNAGDPNRGSGMQMNMDMAAPSSTDGDADNEALANTVKDTKTRLDEASEQIADTIIKMLEDGVAPWQKPWTGGNFLPVNYASGRSYNGLNIWSLLGAMQVNGWTDNRWMTFKQAQKLGGRVIKGSKSTPVIFMSPVKKTKTDPKTGEEKEYTFWTSRVHRVFNVAQIEGIEIEELERQEPVEVTEAERQILELYKNRPKVNNTPQDQAYYTPLFDEIFLPLREQFPSAANYFETLVHELAHSTGHETRLDRSGLTDNYGSHRASRGLEELIAEITVALVAGRLNADFSMDSVASYADSWLKSLKNDKSMILAATRAAQAAADYMLGDFGKDKGTKRVDDSGNPLESPEPAETPAVEEPPSEGEGDTPAPSPSDEPDTGLPPVDISLTEGGNPLPPQTTWDRFYQAALRAGAIENPIDELDAVNMVQELARQDGFELYEVPATRSSWQRGKGTRKSQQTWWDYLRRIGMTVRTSDDRNVGESGLTGEQIVQEAETEAPATSEDSGTEQPNESFDPLSVDTGRELTKGFNVLHTPEDFSDVEKPRGNQSPSIISSPPQSERTRGDFMEVELNLYRDIVDSMSKDIPIVFSYGGSIVSGVPVQTWSQGLTGSPNVDVELPNGRVTTFNVAKIGHIDPNESSRILNNLGFRTSEDRNVGDSGQTGEEIAEEAEEFFMEPPQSEFKTYTDDPDQFYEDVEVDELNPPTPREQDAVEQYQDTNASLVNDRLRRDPDFADEAIVRNLDSMVTKTELTEDTLLYRVVQLNIGDEAYEQFSDLQPGDVLTDKGFASTSASRKWASEYYNPPLFGSRYNSSVILEIQAPAGTQGMVPHLYTAGDRRLGELKKEYEFVLARNTKLEVVSINPSTGVITVRIVK